MTIRANHVTLLRIILLPLPCYLMFGRPTEKIIALCLFTLLGLTDYLDGYLARRQGVTTLGMLMDPVADKIFITAIYIPFAKMHIVPAWMVVLLFVREFGIVELRRVWSPALPTSKLAKCKTSIQMIGAGFIFLIDISGKSSYVFIPIGACFLLAVLPAVLSRIRAGNIGGRSATAAILVGTVFCARLFLSPKKAIWIIMAVIMAATLASGIRYIADGWTQLKPHLIEKLAAWEWACLLGMVLIFPTIYVFLSQATMLATWVVLVVLCLEFATRGLNSLLITSGILQGYIPRPVKTLFQIGMGALALILMRATQAGARPEIMLILWAILAYTLFYSFRHFYVHRVHLMAARFSRPLP
jgi:cardiolipin synthase